MKNTELLEQLYAEYETLGKESSEKKLRRKEVKDQMIEIMKEEGVDEIIINGLDTLVKLALTYPEQEVLNKKRLAEALDVKQKELSKPQTWIQLTNEGKITEEMIEEFTEIEEREQFHAQEHEERDNEED
ncbi:hypothetical protein CN918_25215 [Priestia megaterium]|nr:hypothetical protein CN918_25215 [Priestia megaterium]